MDQSFHHYWLHQGNTIIPNVLIRYYKILQLTEQECLLIAWWLQTYHEEYFPMDFEKILELFSLSENQVFQIIQHLLNRQCLTVISQEQPNGKKQEYYSLTPLLQQLEILYRQSLAKKSATEEPNLLFIIEQEFGRSLSSFEIQTIASWQDQDQYPHELILAALKEAVLNQVFTLNYMDKILLTWQRKGITSVQQVIMEKNRVKSGNFVSKQSQPKEIPPVPLENWLD